MKTLALGQGALVLCALFYLIWWRLGFYPGVHTERLSGVPGIFFGMTAVSALAGIILTLRGRGLIPADQEFMSGGAVLAAAAVLYLVLLAATSFLLKRQVTTELFLIVGWSAMELSVFLRTYAGGLLTQGEFKFMLILLLAAFILSLVFYLAYYEVSPMTGFIFGALPLITEGLVMGIFLVLLLKG